MSKIQLPEGFDSLTLNTEQKALLNDYKNVKLTPQFIIDAY